MVGNMSETASAKEKPSIRRARILAENDLDLLFELVKLRKVHGLSQQDLAERLGVTQATIASFERHDNDPKLSTIRRYAHAVGALVHHVVEPDLEVERVDSIAVVEWKSWAASVPRRKGPVTRSCDHGPSALDSYRRAKQVA